MIWERDFRPYDRGRFRREPAGSSAANTLEPQPGFRVGCPGNFDHLAVAFGFVQAGAADGRQSVGVEVLRQPGERPVGLVHAAVLEENLVGASGFGPAGEQQQAGGHAVQPVDGHQVWFVQFYAQAGHRGLAHKAAVGSRGQKVRFVDHHDVAVFVQHGEVERDGVFLRDRTVEEVEAAGHDGVAQGCGEAGFVGQATTARMFGQPGPIFG